MIPIFVLGWHNMRPHGLEEGQIWPPYLELFVTNKMNRDKIIVTVKYYYVISITFYNYNKINFVIKFVRDFI